MLQEYCIRDVSYGKSKQLLKVYLLKYGAEDGAIYFCTLVIFLGTLKLNTFSQIQLLYFKVFAALRP